MEPIFSSGAPRLSQSYSRLTHTAKPMFADMSRPKLTYNPFELGSGSNPRSDEPDFMAFGKIPVYLVKEGDWKFGDTLAYNEDGDKIFLRDAYDGSKFNGKELEAHFLHELGHYKFADEHDAHQKGYEIGKAVGTSENVLKISKELAHERNLGLAA